MNELVAANRANKFGANSMKQKADKVVEIYTRKAMREGVTIKQLPADFDFVWYVPNRRKDKDNISSAVKFIFDGFVKAGLIENDGWKQVGDINHTFDIDKEEPRVEVYFS